MQPHRAVQDLPGCHLEDGAGGEIDCLDPGGFGAVTITKSITLDGGGGIVASILAAPGVNGVNVNAAGGVVILRNLRINGAGGPTGVSILAAAKVVIEKCDIFGFTTGAAVLASVSTGTLQLKLQELTLNNNGGGITIKPSGGATVNAAVERTRIDGNTGAGMRVDGTGGGSSNVAVTDSSLSLNGSNGLNAVSGASGNVKVDLTRDVMANNGGAALQSNNSSGGTSTMTVGQSMLSNNASAWSIVSSGQLLSYGNNQVTGPVGTGPTGGGIAPQ